MGYAPRPGFIPGVAVNFGGHLLVCAPLGLLKSREFSARMREIGEAPTEEQMEAISVDFILASLQRNYPAMTDEELRTLLDARSIEEAAAAIRGGSGLKLVTPGELTAGG